VSIRGNFHHKPSVKPSERHNTPILSKLFQASPVADPAAWRSPWSGGNKWYWQINSTQDTCRKAEAKSRPIQGILMPFFVD